MTNLKGSKSYFSAVFILFVPDVIDKNRAGMGVSKFISRRVTG